MTIQDLTKEAREAVQVQGTDIDTLTSVLLMAHITKARSEEDFLRQCLKTVRDLLDTQVDAPMVRLTDASRERQQRMVMALKLVEQRIERVLVRPGAPERAMPY